MKIPPAIRVGLLTSLTLLVVGLIVGGYFWQENPGLGWLIFKRLALVGLGLGLAGSLARAIQYTDAHGRPIGKDWPALGCLAGLILAGYVTQQALSASATMKQVQPGEVLEIAGPTLDGQEFSLEQYRGKVVLIDFWATWCGPCVAELPNVKQAYARYHNRGLEIVGVSFDQSRQDLIDFVQQEQIPWPQIMFEDEARQGFNNPNGVRYQIDAIPATLLVDKEGCLIAKNLRGPEVSSAIGAALGILPSLGERLSELPWQLLNWLAIGIMSSRWFVVVVCMVLPALAVAAMQRALTRPPAGSLP